MAAGEKNLQHHHRFRRVLVANRGEIAIRVLRAASELGLRTVAIYTFEDRYSLHRYKADESYCIGTDKDALQPYLDIEAILLVAKRARVDAIHPGYGFLSENAQFARRCQEEDITFIGPAATVLEQFGDKRQAKELARSIGLPVIEENQQPLTSVDVAIREAKRIGFPVMTKALAGGGGRGMRLVENEAELTEKFAEASREAKRAFGDATIFLEKYVNNPKHIEIQILADHYGNVVHLYERDCSVQRRFQKIVEVAPCLSISQETKDKLYSYALELARKVDYQNAGTVEFLVDPKERIYFIEVNPRIQVEHTVTEEITGIDIVRSQFLIAMGYPLSHPTIYIDNQEAVQASGFAIQCRITTEDPKDNFRPDYGTLIAYRSASGFGIRLDAGNAYAGAVISPFFDSLLVKVTGWGRTMKGASERLHRALREFRFRGVKTNTDFLLNLLRHEAFLRGEATVHFIDSHPELLDLPKRHDRSTKALRYLANVIVNGNADVKAIDESRSFREPVVPEFDPASNFPTGSRDRLRELGREDFLEWLKKERAIQFTDTTFRDAHQSLFATRLRTYDMLRVAESYARHHGGDLFSIEMWGGATFDVALRFLKECPWKRLQLMRQAMPNVCFQMLLRGSNAVGYTAYPDNLIEKFIEQAAASGMDIFRIFDSLNWVEAMKTSIRSVREATDAIAEVCLCYTGDITDKEEKKYTLAYYLDLAKRIEDEGAHILAIKDMAGLLKPQAAEILIGKLRESVDIPIHLHTHDTAGVQTATYMRAIDAGVDVVDVALAPMSGLTSQPNFNSLAAILKGHEREHPIDVDSLNNFDDYWEKVREQYYSFESELRAGTAEVYTHEIPGGQYSNLRPQARALGLEDKFDTIKENYRLANDLLGNLIKVTPASKVVGDLAMFMTANNLSATEVMERGGTLAFPESVKALMRGDLGQAHGGFPKELQKLVLKDEAAYTDRPNAHLTPVDFAQEMQDFKKNFSETLGIQDFVSYKLYPEVYKDFFAHQKECGDVSILPTTAFFYGLKPNEEIYVAIEEGKTIAIKYLNTTEPNDQGIRLVFFLLNGETRRIEVEDRSLQVKKATNKKAEGDMQIGAPLQGSLTKLLVSEGDSVDMNSPLFVIEAMKMESTITAAKKGKIKKIYLSEGTLVDQNDLVVELS